MANSSDADLMSVGQHCSAEGCGQIDFLPFKCDCCNNTFCLEHRTYESHNCPRAGCRQTEVIVCPLCARAIKLGTGQDANEAFARHQREGCDPSNYARVHKKPGCPVQACREKLTMINKYECKTCGLEVCMKHRLPADHKCDEVLAARRAQQSNRWANFFGGNSGASQPQRKKSVQRAKPTSVPVRRRQPQPSPNRAETCPQCGAQFSSVQELIEHAEVYHPSGSNPMVRHDACPRCGRQFSDAVALVNHVENGRCGARRSACVMN